MANICFIWYFDKSGQVFDNWRDGLRSALELIEKDHRVDWYLNKKLPSEASLEKYYDFVLVWDDSNTETTRHLQKAKRKGICLTTDPNNIENLRNFDVIFCESQPVYEAVRSAGLRAIKAFGTDTDFFSPDDTKKDIEYYFPGTFSPWKLQREIAHLGPKLTCIGTVQPDGIYDLTKCLDNGVNVKEGYFPVETIRDYYRRSQKVIIPSVHGSERTVLESLSCGIKPEVLHKENVKTYSYIQELEESGLSPREFVVKYYSHEVYAKQLLKGILE